MFRRAAAFLFLLLACPAAPAGALMSLRPGDAAPAFALPDLSGGSLALGDLAGRPAVVVFFSTWSPRSAEVLEDFKAYHAAYATRGLAIVAIDTDGENLDAARTALVREYVAAHAPPYPVLLDGRLAAFAAWGVEAQPTEVILDAAGRIRYVLAGYPLTLRDELREEIERALGIAAPPPSGATTAAQAPAGMARQHFNLARQLLARGEPERAVEELRRSAEEDPTFFDAALLRARVALALGDLPTAEQFVRRTAPEAVGRGDLRYLLGGIMLRKGELDGAERAFRGLRERSPREGWGAWGLGLVALARGDRAAALADLREARELQPENVEGEAWLRHWVRDRCLRQDAGADDEAIVQLFPALAEIEERYCLMRGQGRR
jgi:peroxiredoxin Q/BCP